MSIKFSVASYFATHSEVIKRLDHTAINTGIELIRSKIEGGKKVITCGNGGSAMSASHFITDWNKMVNLHIRKKFRGFSLCDNLGLITAYGNDTSFDNVFSGQLQAIMDEGDLLIAISGSGNSRNVINAVEYANSIGGDTLALVGYDGGELLRVAKNHVLVNCFDMQVCEDIHLMFGHMVMKALCGLPINNTISSVGGL